MNNNGSGSLPVNEENQQLANDLEERSKGPNDVDQQQGKKNRPKRNIIKPSKFKDMFMYRIYE